VRGGAFDVDSDYALLATSRHGGTTTEEIPAFGFRVAFVPEPATLSLLALGGLALLRRKK
jgi:hypothetical protein